MPGRHHRGSLVGQWRKRRGRADRRDQSAQAHGLRGRASGSGIVPPRRHRRRTILQSLSDRLGPSVQYAVEVVQEGYPRRRHTRAADRSLAQTHQIRRRGPIAISSRDRHCPDALRAPDDQGSEPIQGAPQLPAHGISMAYTFDSDAPTRKEMQHFELLGDRAIWYRGWKAVARHPKGTDFETDRWELYHLDTDFAEIEDLAAQHPDRLREMIELWWSEAGKYDVLPLDDRDWERAAERLRMNQRSRYEFLADMARIDRLSAPDISDRSYVVPAEFEQTAPAASGVLLAW